MILFPNAKINLGLNITRRRPDGYHDLISVMVPVDWTDVLEIVPSSSGHTTLTTLGRHVDCPPEQNLVMKAYNALDHEVGLPPVDIYLEKIIPDGAGLGGGSADASFTLRGLNEMFELGLSDDRLAQIASTLGADCPLFIYNRPMLATGTGTTLSPVDLNLHHYHILILKPDVSVATRQAYAGVTPRQPQVDIIDRLSSGSFTEIVNDFEESVFPQFPTLAEIKAAIQASGAIYASMSGSGSSIYGIYTDETVAREALDLLGHLGCARLCHTVE